MDSRTVIKRLEKDGWYYLRQAGDHVHFGHPTKNGIVTVNHPTKDMKKGTLKAIERQSGVSMK